MLLDLGFYAKYAPFWPDPNMFRIEFLFLVNSRKNRRPYKIGKARKCNRTITKAILPVVGQSGYGCLDAYVHALVDS